MNILFRSIRSDTRQRRGSEKVTGGTRVVPGRIALIAWLFTALFLAVPIRALSVADTFPDLTTFGLEGALPELKGKVVLVDFFASWCGPCKASFPVMQELHQKYASKGLVVIAVNLDDEKGEMKRFMAKHPSDFAVVRDASKKLVSAVKIAGMPSSFLLDGEGRINAIHKGFNGDETKRKYIEEIEALIK